MWNLLCFFWINEIINEIIIWLLSQNSENSFHETNLLWFSLIQRNSSVFSLRETFSHNSNIIQKQQIYFHNSSECITRPSCQTVTTDVDKRILQCQVDAKILKTWRYFFCQTHCWRVQGITRLYFLADNATLWTTNLVEISRRRQGCSINQSLIAPASWFNERGRVCGWASWKVN